jgi:SAM-dependent methyltransferase
VDRQSTNPIAVCEYEEIFARKTLGETLRPGGLDLTRRALELMRLPRNARVLDAGCGTGRTVEYLSSMGFNAFGLDLSTQLLQAGCRENTGLPVFQADASTLPVASNSLDMIITECSLSVFRPSKNLLEGFFRSLRPGGTLVVTDLYSRNPAGLRELQSVLPCGCFSGALVRGDVEADMGAAGFTSLFWEDHPEVIRSMDWNSTVLSLAGAPPAGMDTLDLVLAITRAKLGYFIYAAQKRDQNDIYGSRINTGVGDLIYREHHNGRS